MISACPSPTWLSIQDRIDISGLQGRGVGAWRLVRALRQHRRRGLRPRGEPLQMSENSEKKPGDRHRRQDREQYLYLRSIGPVLPLPWPGCRNPDCPPHAVLSASPMDHTYPGWAPPGSTTIPAVYGPANTLLVSEVNFGSPSCRIEGRITEPTCGRSRRCHRLNTNSMRKSAARNKKIINPQPSINRLTLISCGLFPVIVDDEKSLR